MVTGSLFWQRGSAGWSTGGFQLPEASVPFWIPSFRAGFPLLGSLCPKIGLREANNAQCSRVVPAQDMDRVWNGFGRSRREGSLVG